jgi:CSLREA domain-containing protein
MTKYGRFLAVLSLLFLGFVASSLASANSSPLTLPLSLDPLPLLQTQPVSPTETVLDVFITEEGIFPPVLTVLPGTTIEWTNQTSQTQHLEGANISGPTSIYLPLIFKDSNGVPDSSLVDGEAPTPNTLPGQETTWQSGDLPAGDSFSRTFDQPGEYSYLLTNAPTLSGTIVVAPQEFAHAVASIIAVTTHTDDRTLNGNCTLREAIIAVNTNQAVDKCPAGNEVDIIVLESGTYSLTLTGQNEDSAASGDLDITNYSNVTITGTGETIINAQDLSDRVFQVLDWGKLTLSDVTVSNGHGLSGGIYNRGTVTINRSSIRGNVADDTFGGGLQNDGYATINDSTISDNTADFAGGIFNRGILTVNNSTVSSNSAYFMGGGIENEGALTLKHTTVSSNTAQHAGGIRRSDGTIKFQNSLIAGNTAFEDPTHADCDNLSSGSLGYNLVGNGTGCPTTSTDLTVNPAQVFTTVLGPLQDNGGNTLTHALLPGSPAIDAVPLDKCDFDADQRGVARPQGQACDIGAFEFEETGDPAQTGPIFTVNTADDTDDGVCGVAHCSLREAINAANKRPNNAAADEVRFNIPAGGPQIISPTTTLPVISDTVKIDGSTQPGFVDAPIITLNGALAGELVNGLDINASNNTVRKLVIRNFSGAGIQVTGGISNTWVSNSIFDNGKLGIDLNGDGVTPNDVGTAPNFDPDTGPNNLQNFPVLTGAFPDGSSTRVEGRLNSTANTVFTLEFFTNPTCDESNFGEGQTFLGTAAVTTDGTGDAIFTNLSFPVAVPLGRFVTATATGPDGTSEFSQCVPVSLDNDSWPTAFRLNPGGGSASFEQFIDQQGQSRWFKFTVQPNSQVIVSLTNLPENYDLTLYKDIQAAFDEITNPDVQDLIQLNAEFAGDAFAADAVARGARSPDAIARGARSPAEFAANAFSPDAIARGARSPDDFARGARSPEAFAPDAFAPDAYTPDALARGARSQDEIARGARSPEAFSSAQTRSLIGLSAFEGTASEGIIANTWNNTGDFYIRVKGRNGTFSLDAPFHLQVQLISGGCGSVSASLPATSLTANGGNYQTIILTDLARMEGTAAEKATLQARLATFAARPDVAGVVVNVGADARVAAANAQADSEFDCPYAKNLVAEAIKMVIDRYRAANPLQYVLLIGNDDVIPFFRYPDRALLGPESDYVPPVFSFTASEASLRLDYVLGQDEYGSQIDLSFQVSKLPIPDLAVGRLVETASEATRMLDAYLATANGVVTPTSALVTGYDFFADAAVEIQTQLESGLGLAPGSADSLITARDVSPEDPRAWTADQLRTELLGSRHDVTFLGGHFSASSALAADYKTRLLAGELASSPVNLENVLIFSIGCHSGYNIVNAHGIPGVTLEPDWAQAFARKGATLIAGTGYQYGDTDFLEYSERIYLEFSKQLRTGSGPVAIGPALATAKQIYLAQTPQLRALHEKSLLEATIFGFPMLKINMPGSRLTPPSDASIVSGVNGFTDDPGATLALKYADVGISPSLVATTIQLKDVEDDSTVEAIYLRGSDGVVTNPNEPALPLEMNNVSGPGTLVLRGVGFRGGNYSDTPNVRALVGAPTTEIRSVHLPFFSDVFYPIQPWNVNYFDALANGDQTIRLAVTPAQFKSTTPGAETNTLRRFNNMDFRLYYSNNTAMFEDVTPALSAAPVIANVSAPLTDDGSVNFRIRVVGDPVAGMQEVWVTYTTACPAGSACSGTWQTLDLTQNVEDSTLWEATINFGNNPQNIRYIVQAVNGVGLASLATNLGAYYIPGVEATDLQPTALLLDLPASTSGPYGTEATFSAVLTGETGQPLPGRIVFFGLGAQNGSGLTDGNGRATATLPLLGLPGDYEVRAAFPGTSADAASTAPNTFQFEISKQNTILCLEPQSASNDDTCQQPASFSGNASDDALLVATLTDAAGRRLFEKTVVFVVTGSEGSHSESIITDYAGRAFLGNLPLPPGTYTVTAYFSGNIPLSTGQTITLDDPRYNPSTRSSSLILQNSVPEAESDAYTVNQNDALTVAAPGVLANDIDANPASLIAILVAGPSNGDLILNANGSFFYEPNLNFSGIDTFTYKANNGSRDSNIATVTITVKPKSLDCSTAQPDPAIVWPPNNKFRPISIYNVGAPNSKVTIKITSIFQDEPVGKGSQSPDGKGLGKATTQVRAERDGAGNGRVYHISFTATDKQGGSCSGKVRVAVPHDQSNQVDLNAIDGGPLYDSTKKSN